MIVPVGQWEPPRASEGQKTKTSIGLRATVSRRTNSQEGASFATPSRSAAQPTAKTGGRPISFRREGKEGGGGALVGAPASAMLAPGPPEIFLLVHC